MEQQGSIERAGKNESSFARIIRDLVAYTTIAIASLLHSASSPAKADNTPKLVLEDHVDHIEYNNFYGAETGDAILDQIIFYRMDHEGNLEVVAWRMVPTEKVCRKVELEGAEPEDKCKFIDVVPTKKGKTMIPIKQPDGSYEMTWFDGKKLRIVTSDSFEETWTVYDPEVEAREELSQALRLELSSSLAP